MPSHLQSHPSQGHPLLRQSLRLRLRGQDLAGRVREIGVRRLSSVARYRVMAQDHHNQQLHAYSVPTFPQRRGLIMR